ncbi:hypothetical protein JKP88DRAFT_289336 [Tribonema minus]|uniref:Reverse transcriptase domain-containing protein n=1 Tax=Tribonema minus TaxID=303371 RepID=A0A836CGN9_9STRA|nr:hypothetical protein JKP88DRAFT_289336 [Tribonema minus]
MLDDEAGGGGSADPEYKCNLCDLVVKKGMSLLSLQQRLNAHIAAKHQRKHHSGTATTFLERSDLSTDQRTRSRHLLLRLVAAAPPAAQRGRNAGAAVLHEGVGVAVEGADVAMEDAFAAAAMMQTSAVAERLAAAEPEAAAAAVPAAAVQPVLRTAALATAAAVMPAAAAAVLATAAVARELKTATVAVAAVAAATAAEEAVVVAAAAAAEGAPERQVRRQQRQRQALQAQQVGQQTEAAINAYVLQCMGTRGGLQQAARFLQPKTVAIPDDDCFAAMQSKHPPAAPGEQLHELSGMVDQLVAKAADMPAELSLLQGEGIEPETVAKLIQRASPYSGAGLSGLRYSHLQDALRTSWGRHEFAAVLTRWLQTVMREAARLPDAFWQLHGAGRLTPLAEQQEDGTAKQRPIVCGEVLQRLCTSVYVADRKDFLAELLEPDGQYGVAVSAGAEKAAMAGKLAYELGHWQFMLDLKNAFNMVFVLAAAEWVAAQLPDFLDYFIGTYVRTRPRLLFQHVDGSTRIIMSQRGFKQGDPAAPMLFCGAIAQCLKRFNEAAAAQRARRRMGAYMDDANVRTGARTLTQDDIQAVAQLKQHFAEVGLELNLTKSRALPGRGHVVTDHERQLLQQLGVQLVGDTDENQNRGAVLLGVPVGHSSFVDAWLRREAGAGGAGARFAERCARLTSPRAMFRLLRYCVVPRMTYCLRTIPTTQTAPAAKEWDRVTQWVLEHSMGLQPPGQTWRQFEQSGAHFHLAARGPALQQARLPTRHGGLGITSACDIADAAYVAGTLQALQPALSGWAGVLQQAAPQAAADNAAEDAATQATPAAAAAAPAPAASAAATVTAAAAVASGGATAPAAATASAAGRAYGAAIPATHDAAAAGSGAAAAAQAAPAAAAAAAAHGATTPAAAAAAAAAAAPASEAAAAAAAHVAPQVASAASLTAASTAAAAGIGNTAATGPTSLRAAAAPATGAASAGGAATVPAATAAMAVAAANAADKVEADLQQLPQGTQRTQALARFRSQRHMHSIGMAFLNEPMYSTTASFDGLSWQLAVKRAIGVEEQTAGCKLCGKSPGGTLHARLCQAPRVKAHDTIVHNSVKRATQRLLRQYLKTGLVDEDYTPFLGMDIVLPADAFPVTGYDDPTRHLPLMVDVTCFEAQVASRAAKTAADPERCCRDQEAAKTTHYSGHYDQNCYKLATLAIGSFGSIGEQGRKLLEAVATEYASRMSVPGGARPKALKGIALARLRSALSAALHMAYSGRVMTHMAESRGGGHMEEDVGEDPEMPFGGGGAGSTTIMGILERDYNCTWHTHMEWPEEQARIARQRCVGAMPEECFQKRSRTDWLDDSVLERAVFFSVVREPVSRFVSGYKQAVAAYEDVGNWTMTQYMEAYRVRSVNEHTLTQTRRIGVDDAHGRQIPMHFIASLENLEEDLALLWAHLGVPPIENFLRMRSAQTDSRKYHLETRLTADQLRELCWHLGQDFLCFGYPLPSECR